MLRFESLPNSSLNKYVSSEIRDLRLFILLVRTLAW